MRFLDTRTGAFVERDPGETVFAILSHTWDNDDEQTYEELRDIQRRYEVPKSQNPQNNPTASEVCGLSSRK